MNEIDQLRADIATLEAAENIIGNMCNENNTTAHMQRILKMHRQKLSRLEAEAAAEADPWSDAREAIPLHLENGGHRVKRVAEYARHLEQRVADLEKEVRCERIDGGKVHADLKARIAELEAELVNEAKNREFWLAENFRKGERLAAISQRIDDDPEWEQTPEGETGCSVIRHLNRLRSRINCLEMQLNERDQELAKRPVVYVARRNNTQSIQTSYENPILYASEEHFADCMAFPDWWTLEPYTGEQK